MAVLTNHPLKRLIAEQIVSGLQRKAVTTCSRWAEKYRVMGTPFPGAWTFKYHPWLLDMHDTDATMICGQKAAQVGYTEWAMNVAFFSMDVKALNVLYVLPTSSDASDFSTGRFDPALELSPHLQNFFGDADNVGLKRAGGTILYVRGSHSRSKLKSIPTPVIIKDEIDEMPDWAVALMEARQGGQVETIDIELSTPTIEDYGINKSFKLSTQDYFTFRCPSCSKYISLTAEDNLVVVGDSLTDKRVSESYLKCHLCDNKLPVVEEPSGAMYKPWLLHKKRGGTAEFISTYTDRERQGFHVSQLYSMAKVGHPKHLAIASLKSKLDPTYAQEWHNSKLGITFTAPGAKVNDEQYNKCLTGHERRKLNDDRPRTFGCDVGTVLHLTCMEWYPLDMQLPGLAINDRFRGRLIEACTTTGSSHDFDEAFQFFMDLRCRTGVVDAEPERRAALQFAQRLWGRILLCDYLYSQQGREAQVSEEECMIKVNRTAWLDLTLGRFRNQTIDLPINLDPDFKKHIKEPTRVFKEDKWGQPYGVYVNENADHYAHSLNYAEIALPSAVGLGSNRNITELY